PGARRPHPGDEVEQGGLAGAVGPDHADDLAARHLERDVLEDLRAADAQPHTADLQGRDAGPGVRGGGGTGVGGRTDAGHRAPASGGATWSPGTTSMSSGTQLSPSCTRRAVNMSWISAWSLSRMV